MRRSCPLEAFTGGNGEGVLRCGGSRSKPAGARRCGAESPFNELWDAWQRTAKDEGDDVSEVIFILCFNIISFGCSSQLLYNDLLDTVNYSASKQKLISLLIILIRLMDEQILRLQGKLLKKTIITCHYLSLQIRIITTLCNQINKFNTVQPNK